MRRTLGEVEGGGYCERMWNFQVSTSYIAQYKSE